MLFTYLGGIIGDQIGMIFIQNHHVDIASIINMIISIALYGIYSWFQYVSLSVQINFRHTSLGSFTNILQSILFHLSTALALISSIIPYCCVNAQYGLICIMVLIYISPLVFLFMANGFFFKSHTIIFLGLSISGAILCVIEMVFIALSQEVQVMIVVVFALIVIIVMISMIFIIRKNERKTIMLLETIQTEPDQFDILIGNLFKALSVATRGFRIGHPFVLSWHFMRMVTERWPYATDVWILWARFTSAFPDEVKLTQWIDEQLQKHVYSSSKVMSYRGQIHALLQSRETSMTKQIKHQINECQRKIFTCRNQMRVFWENVFQGNLNEIAKNAISTQETMTATKKLIKQMIKEYPNNHYVIRTYIRFLSDTSSDKMAVAKWTEKYKMLKMGQSIKMDLSQKEALDIFPTLVSVTMQKQKQNPNQAELMKMSNTTTSFYGKTMNNINVHKDNQNQDPIFLAIRSSLKDLKIPVIKYTALILFILYALWFIIVIPFFSELVFNKYKRILDIIEYSYISAMIRSIEINVGMFSFKHAAVLLGIETADSLQIDDVDNHQMYKHYILELETYLNRFRTLRQFDGHNAHITNALNMLFNNENFYQLFMKNGSKYDVIYANKSVESGIVAVLLRGTEISRLSTVDEVIHYFNETSALEIMSNINYTSQYLTNINIEFDEAITDIVGSLDHSSQMIVDVCLVFFGITYIISLSVLTSKFFQTKAATTRCFLMIPKHQVANIFENLTNDKHNQEEGDTNIKWRQDEKVLSVFSKSILSHSSVAKAWFFVIFTTVIYYICLFALGMYTAVQVKSMGDFFNLGAPIVNYFTYPYGILGHIVMHFYSWLMIDRGYLPGIFDADAVFIAIAKQLDKAVTMYNYFIFGNDTYNIIPLQRFSPTIVAAQYKGENKTEYAASSNRHDIYGGLSYNTQFFLAVVFLKKISFEKKNGVPINGNGELTESFHIVHQHLYLEFIDQWFGYLANVVNLDYNENHKVFVINIFVGLVLGLACHLIIFAKMLSISKNFKRMLNLILCCSPEVILESEQVMRILSGDFSDKIVKAKKLSNTVFEAVIKYSKTPILETKPNFIISNGNYASKELFGDNVVGKQFKTLLTLKNEVGNNPYLSSLDQAVSGRCMCDFWQVTKLENVKGEILYMEIGMMAFSKKGWVKSRVEADGVFTGFVFIFNDVTNYYNTQEKLDKETEEAQNLWKTIIPAQILPNIIAGDEISFNINSATIIVVSLIDISALSASFSANQLMEMLTRIYKVIDTAVAKYHTIEKIRTFGTDYIAASGFFETVAPEVHAKEAIKFSFEALNSINSLCKSWGMTLKTKIGISSGGPIMAGILSGGQPNFEMIGSTYDDAFKMMETGEPGQVHVTKYVYELIFGSAFKIREGKDVIINQNVSQTFYVEPF